MLINFLPPILQEIKEYKLIMGDEDKENERLYLAIADLENNQYVTTCTESGISKYEKMLKIMSKGDDTLEDRRFRVLSLYNKQLPYTIISLKKDLSTLCGKDGISIDIDYKTLVLTAKVALIAKEMFQIVNEYLESIVPLNMIINLMLLYNQYMKYEKYTYEQLKKYTYQQLREDVI